MSQSATPSAEEFPSGLPCPEPLWAAVEGGVFGREEGGPIVPAADDVAALTLEHAREMVVLLLDSTYLERCAAHGVSPESGRPPRNDELRQRLTVRLQRELAQTRDQYESCLDVYEAAFGEQAARHLDEFVRVSIESIEWTETSGEQRMLFD